MLWIIIAIILSYFLGSIPTAYLSGRILKGIDIRQFGSGNVGATNALRVLGKGPGIIVLVLDMLKGLISVVFLADLLSLRMAIPVSEIQRIIFGLACIIGHNCTIFLRFKGGKGVATTLGVLCGLALNITGLKWVLVLALLTWFMVFFILRIVSIASVITGLGLPIYTLLLKSSPGLLFLSLVVAILILLRHIPNLKRFFRGEEPTLSFKKKSGAV